MKKYMIPALLLLLSNEIISMLAVAVMMFMLVFDVLRRMPV